MLKKFKRIASDFLRTTKLVYDFAQHNSDWSKPPGNTIKDILKEKNLSVKDFANIIGFSEYNTEKLLLSETEITPLIAYRLTNSIGGSIRFLG
ncbi:MAG: hypothetical protein DWQ19_09045 [Crenarchaeota archaeon]|nr:MAG: hypothetical protein DWQ19_09045 [Thermoproteota archaeon]